MSKPTCSFAGCHKAIKARDWCSAHYERWRKHGDPAVLLPPVSPPRAPSQTETCVAKGCALRPLAKNLCAKHYRANRLHGDPLIDKRRIRQPCIHPDCGELARSRGYCHRHYLRIRATGSPYLTPRRVDICTIEGCTTRTTTHAVMCERHYTEMWRYGTLNDRRCADCPRHIDRSRKRCISCALIERYRISKDLGHARRVKMRESRVERVDTRLVYARDRWVCQLCASIVDPNLVWPNPMSASLDHIRSISNGGEHTYLNTQLAHLRCNTAKGNRDVA